MVAEQGAEAVEELESAAGMSVFAFVSNMKECQ